MTIFDGLPDLLTDPDTGFGEPVIYRPVGAPTSEVTISAVWDQSPVLALAEDMRADQVAMKVDVRAADCPDLAEGDEFERVATGVVGKAVPPIQPDGIGIVSVTLQRVTA